MRVLSALRRRLVARRTTFYIRHAIDEWLPPVIREFAPLNRFVGRMFHGPKFDLDFKRHAFHMSRSEFARSYAELTGMAKSRDADTTPNSSRRSSTRPPVACSTSGAAMA